MVRPVYAPHGLGVYAARAVKQRLRDTPVFAVHRILTPAEAEAIVANGDADAVTLVRALIADEAWAEKAAAGRAHEIRACTGCNQGCCGNLLQGLPVACATNPAVGREPELGRGTLARAPKPRRVVVVGGGPAGLEAAWVAAARGHRVVLLERARALGGKVRLAAALPGRAELADFADWRAGECARQGVEIRLGVEADAEAVLALAPDAVVVATGGVASVRGPAKWWSMPVPGCERANVLDHEQALREAALLGPRVVIFDAVGHVEGPGLAELLARRGLDVTLASPLAQPILLDAETLAQALARACRAGASWRPTTGLAAIGEREVTLVHLLSGRSERLADVDHVVIRTHGLPADALYHALRGRVEVLRAGDAVAVRGVDRAVFDGHRAGREV
jgi:NADPH-dependent 2,4-dienoyl-CoA reductase/sulfur reductase-like enzyme